MGAGTVSEMGPTRRGEGLGHGQVVEEVLCLRSAQSACLRAVAVWIWSCREAALKIPVWKSSACWPVAARPTPSVGLPPGQTPLEASSCPQVLPGGWRAAFTPGQGDTSLPSGAYLAWSLIWRAEHREPQPGLPLHTPAVPPSCMTGQGGFFLLLLFFF